MSEEKPVLESPKPEPATMKVATAAPARRPTSRSAFAPIVLIAAGVLFLLSNLGVIGALNWGVAFGFWPLALIFLGLNILVVQMRPPAGVILSALVALLAVGTFGYLLVKGTPVGAMRSLGLPETPAEHAEPFTVPANAARAAEITLELSNYRATVAAGPREDLLTGSIWTRTGLELARDDDGDHSRITVGERPGGFMFNPFVGGADSNPAWEFFLNADVPTDLRIDVGNAGLTADLSQLTLTGLNLDASNGRVTAELPSGDYDVEMDSGNGQVDLTLPGGGSQRMRVEGGNGNVDLHLPQGVEARLEYDTGNGVVRVDDRFERVEGDHDEGAYETGGYQSGEGLLLIVNTGNGSVRVDAP